MTIQRIGVAGLESTDTSIAHRLVGAGFHVTVTDLIRDRVDALASAGLMTADLPSDVAQDADLVLVSVSGDRAVEEVLFEHGGVLETLRQGSLVLDMSTTTPQFSRAATERLAGFGLARMEACLMSHPAMAHVGNSFMLFGGSGEELTAVSEVVRVLATRVVHTGPVGTASRLKAMYQELIGDGFETAANGLIRELVWNPRERLLPTPTARSANAWSGALARTAAPA
jgi:3-hydroxyisobutyrate dehydrogenase-like beta-hydroxyacid dehydrogenase